MVHQSPIRSSKIIQRSLSALGVNMTRLRVLIYDLKSDLFLLGGGWLLADAKLTHVVIQ